MVRSAIPDDTYFSINMSNYTDIVNKICYFADKILNDTVKKFCDILQISKFLQNTLLLTNSHFSNSLIAELIPHVANTSKYRLKNGVILPIEPILLSVIPRNLSHQLAKNITVSFFQNSFGHVAMMDFILISYSAKFPESLFLSRNVLEKYEGAFVFIWSIIRLKYLCLESSKQRLKLLKLLGKLPLKSEF